MNEHEIFELLDGAKVVRYDRKNALLLVWRGGHGITAYDPWWCTAAFWNTSDFSDEDASVADVQESMERHIAGEVEYVT